MLAGRVALVLAGAYAAATLATAPADRTFGDDLGAYLGAADRLVAGAPLYPAAGPDGLTPGGEGAYFYPPLVAAAFVPLAQLPPQTARMTWYALLIALAVAVGAWLVRSVPSERRAWALAACLAYLPLLSELRYGNLNLVTLALCLAAWRFRDRAPLAGALLAAALGIKLLPLALVLFLVAAGRWRIVAWTAGIGLASVVLSWPWLGSAWSDYLAVLRAIGLGVPSAGSNIVPAALAAAPFRYLLPALGLSVAALAGLAVRRRGGQERAFTTALAAAPLVATTVWYPYLVLALPAILGSHGGGRDVGPTRAGVIGGGALAGHAPDTEGSAVAGRAAAWLAIQAQLAPVVQAAPLPLIGLLVVVATELRDLVRGTQGAAGSGHILGSYDARPDDIPRPLTEGPVTTDAMGRSDPVP
jgi:hypothetical protein